MSLHKIASGGESRPACAVIGQSSHDSGPVAAGLTRNDAPTAPEPTEAQAASSLSRPLLEAGTATGRCEPGGVVAHVDPAIPFAMTRAVDVAAPTALTPTQTNPARRY